MEIFNTPGTIDRRNTMYPSKLDLVENNSFRTEVYSTTYGFVMEGTLELENVTLQKHQWFSVPTLSTSKTFVVNGKTTFMTRLGFIGQHVLGGPIEETGRLTYIDGCSDSLLVYPPRLGDPTLNVLYFPPGIEQSFHLHPSIRLGVIAKGRGICSTNGGDLEMSTGDVFCLDTMERHRFKTADSEMVVIPFHPDGDWGPTDHNHTMLNRTYSSNK